MFGLAEDNKPLNEDSRFYPRSPYGAAKLYAHWITINYREAYGIFACSGILFNHESPRRGETFVTRKIVRGAVAIVNEKANKLYLGNLDAIRDWGHAKDYVEGMWMMLQQETPKDYVLATGVAITVRDFVERVFLELGKEIQWSGHGVDEKGVDQNGNVLIEIDSDYFRPTEVPFLLGDASKAKRELGWEPVRGIHEMVADAYRSIEAPF
jgi:GDPmannose 4,6-dehydratase